MRYAGLVLVALAAAVAGSVMVLLGAVMRAPKPVLIPLRVRRR